MEHNIIRETADIVIIEVETARGTIPLSINTKTLARLGQTVDEHVQQFVEHQATIAARIAEAAPKTMTRYTVAANPKPFETLVEPDAATGYILADVTEDLGDYKTIRPDLLADSREAALSAWGALIAEAQR